MLSDGIAYADGNRAFTSSLAATTRDQVIDVLTESWKITWMAAVASSVGIFLLVCLEKEVKTSSKLDTKCRLKHHPEKEEHPEKAQERH
jgi:hypothetical protein